MRWLCGRFGLVILGAILLLGGVCWGEQVVLKDGTILQGTVIRQADSIWIRIADGRSRIIPLGEIKSIGGGGNVSSDGSGGSAAFAAARRRAEMADSTIAAAGVWQKFLESNPTPADKAAANAELEKWKKLPEDSERINGQWIGGAERKALVEKAAALAEQAADLIKQNQTVAAMKKLDEAIKAYPNSYPAVFIMGYLNVKAQKHDESIRYFEQALKLRPKSYESRNNLGVALLLAKRDYGRALDLVLKAAEATDDAKVAQNLVNVVATVPANVKETPRGKAAAEAARLLAGKNKLAGATRDYAFIIPKGAGARDDEPDLAGVKSAGTGFIIREDGLILTNRHVVQGAPSLMVLLPDGVQKHAQVVKIDDEQDLALIRIEAEGKLPVVVFAKADMPNEGAKCFMMGYPLLGRMGASVKITQGIISGAGRSSQGTDVVIDGRVNPGNSGGPLLNEHAQVIGIVSMKSRSTDIEDSYGLAVSAGRIRRFLAKNSVSITSAEAEGPAMDAERVAAKAKGATVCVMSVR